MKLITIAAAVLLAAPASFAADYEEFAASFDASAFDNFGSDQLRILTNRYSFCGSFGDSRKTRAEVLVHRYQALAEAIENGDQDKAGEKAAAFVRAAEANPRFERCWNELRHRAGVSSDFVNNVKTIIGA